MRLFVYVCYLLLSSIDVIRRLHGSLLCQGQSNYATMIKCIYWFFKASTATKMAQKMLFEPWHGSDQVKFLHMCGPVGKGHAEVSVSRVANGVTPKEMPSQNGSTKKTKGVKRGG